MRSSTLWVFRLLESGVSPSASLSASSSTSSSSAPSRLMIESSLDTEMGRFRFFSPFLGAVGFGFDVALVLGLGHLGAGALSLDWWDNLAAAFVAVFGLAFVAFILVATGLGKCHDEADAEAEGCRKWRRAYGEVCGGGGGGGVGW